MTVPLLDRPLESAVVDEAHLGDIEGAFGSVRWRQLWPPRTPRRRLAVLLAVMGPGLLALVADNDAGGVSTYAQAGQQEGMRLLWLLLPLGLVLFVNQEMAARLGAVSGVGHARLIVERFGRLWGAFSLGDLVVLNVLTLVTEFIGVRFAAAQLGVPPVPAVAGAAALLLIASLTGSFRHWERVMLLLVAANVALLPALVLAHPTGAAAARAVASAQAGTPFPVLAMALVGTTVAPWQLFFQQSVVVDKRITPAWLGFERVDTAISTVLMLLGAGAVLLIAAAAGDGAGHAAAAGDAGAILHTITQRLGSSAGNVVALLLLDGAVLGAAAVTLATSYAVGDVSGARHSLHRTPSDAPAFYTVLVGLVVGAAAVAALPGVPLGTITVAVQVLAGLLLPSATVFLLLLCNDAAVLGPWVNRPWLNALAAVTVAGLLVLSGVLVVTTLVPGVPAHVLAPVLGAVAAAGLAVVGAPHLHRHRQPRPRRPAPVAAGPLRLHVVHGGVVLVDRRRRIPGLGERDRRAWRTPPLHELRRPAWTRGRFAGMLALRAYVLVSLLLLLGRLVAEALGH